MAGNVIVSSANGILQVLPVEATLIGEPFLLNDAVYYQYANLDLPFSPNDPGLQFAFNLGAKRSSTLAARFFNLLDEYSTPTYFTLTAVAATGQTVGNCLDVRDFGAIGDGVTDDTAAVQAALDQAGMNAAGTTSGGGQQQGLTIRPTTLLNGWSANQHVGAYELGVDQGFNFGLNGPASPYASPSFAFDGNAVTRASAVGQHTQQYYGCVWQFGPSTIQAGTPPWSQGMGSLTSDGSITWRTLGQIEQWQAHKFYANQQPIYDPDTNCVFTNFHSGGSTSGATKPTFNPTLGSFTSESGGPLWGNLGTVGTVPMDVWHPVTVYGHFDAGPNPMLVVEPVLPTAANTVPGSMSEVPIFLHGANNAGTSGNYPPHLNILSEVPVNGQDGLTISQRSAGIWYSLDGGNTWTQVYNSATFAKQWNMIPLPSTQDTSLVQVMAFTDSHNNMAHYVYEINITGAVATPVAVLPGPTVVCIESGVNCLVSSTSGYALNVPSGVTISCNGGLKLGAGFGLLTCDIGSHDILITGNGFLDGNGGVTSQANPLINLQGYNFNIGGTQTGLMTIQNWGAMLGSTIFPGLAVYLGISGANVSSSVNAVKFINVADLISVQGSVVPGNPDDLTNVSFSQGIGITNCVSSGVHENGVALQNVQSFLIFNNRFTKTALGDTNLTNGGISLIDCKNGKIDTNELLGFDSTQPVTNSGAGIYLATGLYGIQNVLVTKNTCNSGNYGIWGNGVTAQWIGVEVSFNICLGNRAWGIHFDLVANSNLNIHDNIASGNLLGQIFPGPTDVQQALITSALTQEQVSSITIDNTQVTGNISTQGGVTTNVSQFGLISYVSGEFTVQQFQQGWLLAAVGGATGLLLNNLPQDFVCCVKSVSGGLILQTSGCLIDGASSMDVAPGEGTVLYFSGSNWETIGSPSQLEADLTLTFGIVAGAGLAASGVTLPVAAPRPGYLRSCKAVIGKSDPSVDFSFKIKKNNVDVFLTDPIVPHGSTADSVLTFTALTTIPLLVAKDDVFTMDIIAGSAIWALTIQIES